MEHSVGETKAVAKRSVEILIVIATIAILAAILYPAVGVAREMEHRRSCLENVKQLAAGYVAYMHDNDMVSPPATEVYANGAAYPASWKNLIFPLVKSREAFECPDNAEQVRMIARLNDSMGSKRSTSWTYLSRGDSTFWTCNPASPHFSGEAVCKTNNPQQLFFARSYGVNGAVFGAGVDVGFEADSDPEAKRTFKPGQHAASIMLCLECAKDFTKDSQITSPATTILISDDKNPEVVATPEGFFARCQPGKATGVAQGQYADPKSSTGVRRPLGLTVVHRGMFVKAFYDGHASAGKLAEDILHDHWKHDCLKQAGETTFPDNVYGSTNSCKGAPSTTGVACAGVAAGSVPKEDE